MSLGDPDNCDAGFDFGPVVTAPDGMSRLRLGGHQAARVRLRGSYDGLEMAYDTLYGLWLPRSDYEPALAPLIYRFYKDPDRTPEADLLLDVLLPITDRARAPGLAHGGATGTARSDP